MLSMIRVADGYADGDQYAVGGPQFAWRQSTICSRLEKIQAYVCASNREAWSSRSHVRVTRC